MIFVHVPLVEPFDFGVSFEQVSWHLLEEIIVEVLFEIFEVAVELLVLRLLPLLPKKISEVNVQDQNDFANGDEGGVKGLLNGTETRLLDLLVQ